MCTCNVAVVVVAYPPSTHSPVDRLSFTYRACAYRLKYSTDATCNIDPGSDREDLTLHRTKRNVVKVKLI